MFNTKFYIKLSVRDYECDMQGIVNNSVYLNYMEHARCMYLKSLGMNFSELTFSGIYLIVSKAELEFKDSLKSNDEFYVTVDSEKESKLKMVYHQNIIRSSDKKLMTYGKITCACLKKGRPIKPESVGFEF